MNKIFQIIRREYITRVRKRAFIIMTILGPLLFGTLMIAPYKLAQLEDSDDKTIAVVELDEMNRPVPQEKLIFKDIIPPKEHLAFDYLAGVDTNTIQHLLELTDYYGVLILNQNLLNASEANIEFRTRKQPSIGVESHIRQSIENFLFNRNLQKMNLTPDEINASRTTVRLKINKLEKDGYKEQKLTGIKRGIGYAAGFLIYFFIFFFGAQVMRGVIEEKTNRVVEVIITSVRPFQLMMGKIIGIALVGLTQFLAWIFLTIGVYQFALSNFVNPSQLPQTQQIAPAGMQMQSDIPAEVIETPEIINIVNSIDISYYFYLLGTFLFYFIFGYLLYGSMFAAIGSAVDSETDTQQFMLPVTIPLILSIIVMINAITNPEGQLVFWFSIIPFTSPVVMMARIPFQPPPEELALSMALLVLTFLTMVWLAGKIYRTGILMYGKKVNYRELLKWIRYRD